MSIIDKLCQKLGVSTETDECRWSQTRCYRQRLKQVKNLWIGSGLVMLVVAQPAFILALCLFLIFLSFAVLEK